MKKAAIARLFFPAYLLIGLLAFHPFLLPESFAQENSGTPKIEDQADVVADDLIHLGDLVDVDVVGNTEFDWRGKLTPEGYLEALTFTEDPVLALCRKPSDIALEIEKEYSKFLNTPEVRVAILDRSGRLPATLYGAVRSQNRYRLLRPVNLSELVVISGGLTSDASGTIEILRQPIANCVQDRESDRPGAERIGSSLRFSVEVKDLVGGVPEANPEIRYGDLVNVKRSMPVYVTGGVGNPSKYEFRSGLTLSRAVDIAGGVLKEGNASSITIFRRTEAGTEVLKADLERIRAGVEADVNLAPYDIVEVAQNGRTSRRFAPSRVVFDPGVEQLSELPLRVIN